MGVFRMESNVAELTGQAQESLTKLFIGQAIEAYEKTGKTPKQIADERDELLAACLKLQEAYVDGDRNFLRLADEAMKLARAAIDKVVGGDK